MPIRHGQGACWRPGEPSYLLQVTRPGDRCSQGGVKVPTGGKGDVAQARERLLYLEIFVWKFPLRGRVSRFGVIPRPTVKVRMKENGCDGPRFCAWLVVPCALILVSERGKP